MSNNIVEISNQDLRPYVSSSKSCKISDSGCKLESKFGKVSFNFGSIEGAYKCKIYAKRISGNGQITLKSENSINKIIVRSKTSQNFDIALNASSLEVSREKEDIGEVVIFRIAIYRCPKDEELTINWKKLIRV